MGMKSATLSPQDLKPELSWPPAPANDSVVLSPEPFGGVLRAPLIADANIATKQRPKGLNAILAFCAVMAVVVVFLLGQFGALTSHASTENFPNIGTLKVDKSNNEQASVDHSATAASADLADGLKTLRLQMHAAVQAQETTSAPTPKLAVPNAPGTSRQPNPPSSTSEVATVLPAAHPPDADATQPGPTTTELRALLERARGMITVGDIASARRLTEFAAAGGDGNALFALAETFDPIQLARWRVRGVRGDAEKARVLYQRALDRGVADAGERLTRLP